MSKLLNAVAAAVAVLLLASLLGGLVLLAQVIWSAVLS